MEIFVGNLASQTTEAELTELFKTYGEVRGAQVKRDLFSGVSKGFGFVEMSTTGEAESAMEALNGTDFEGRTLKVNEARPRESRSGRE